MEKNINDYALIIGIEQYQQMNRLFGSVNDAILFQKWVLCEDGGNIPEDNCKFILAGATPFRPLQNDIDEKLEEIIGDGNHQFRRLYFFFAGHGYGIKWDTNGLCLPGWTTARRRNALSSKDYLDYTISSNFFTEIYFFLDCCRDRKINASAMPPSLDIIKPGGAQAVSLVLFASDFLSPAYEGADPLSSTNVHGYFTKALLMGLKGAAADRDGVITAESLTNFTQLKTSELAKQDNKDQSVTPIFYAPGITMSSMVIKDGIQPGRTIITILSSDIGTITLTWPDLSVQWQHDVTTGQTLELPPLTRGLYILENTSTGKMLTLKIDGTSNTMHYEL